MVRVIGGAKLNGKLSDIAHKLDAAAKVKVGFFETQTYEDGKPVAMVAAIQEFGAPAKGIPPRPFFRNMINRESKKWPQAIGSLLEANDFDARKTLEQTGAAITAQLKESIADTYEPPLSEVTVMLRGMRSDPKYRDMPFWQRFSEAKKRVRENKSNFGASSKPLVDTGELLKAPDFTVE